MIMEKEKGEKNKEENDKEDSTNKTIKSHYNVTL